MLTLHEAKNLILQKECRLPTNDSEKLDQNEESALTKVLAKSNKAANAAFQLVKTAGKNYQFDILQLPL